MTSSNAADMRIVIGVNDPMDAAVVGGKAFTLHSLRAIGVDVPQWCVISSRARDEDIDGVVAQQAIATVTAASGVDVRLFAIRSSSADEDRADCSFAGQFDSFLAVTPERTTERIQHVRRSGDSGKVDAYRRAQGLEADAARPAVIVQRMIDAQASGVAFSADPVSGRRGVAVVSAVLGLGTSLVGGDVDADAFHIDRNGSIIERKIARKEIAHRPDPAAPDGIQIASVDDDTAQRPAITNDQAVAIAALARRIARHMQAPQDIEWAIEDGKLWLLQSRPITTLSQLADPDGQLVIWDNSNIVESYPGITLPLTYSFARHAYEHVYRQFCSLMGVSSQRVENHASTFRQMIGLIRGRVYYCLPNWYRVLALLPGYRSNRSFMEQMMGVSEPLPEEAQPTVERAGWWGRMRDRIEMGRSLGGLIWRHALLPRDTSRFYGRVDHALRDAEQLPRLRLDELASEYRRLENELLTRWDAPIINDFFAMVFYGILGRLNSRYSNQAGLHNALLSNIGSMVSTEPAQRVTEMARLALKKGVRADAGIADAERALTHDDELHAMYRSYLARFGERCLEELKLESPTLTDDPSPLLRSIASAMQRMREDGDDGQSIAESSVLRVEAEKMIAAEMRRRPIRRLLLNWVLRQARARITARENLRFERSRVFGRVRRIFAEIGRLLVAERQLDERRDIFYLEVDEVIGYIEGTASCTDLRGLVAVRKSNYERYREGPAPPHRFATRGAVGLDHLPIVSAAGNGQATGLGDHPRLSATVLRGVGCSWGRVAGPARVVTDPTNAVIQHGEILIAERTDPGWILLFSGAAGIITERGSMLSHSAIIAREMGIPAVVSVADVTHRIRTGDHLEIDGAAGTVAVKSSSPKPN